MLSPEIERPFMSVDLDYDVLRDLRPGRLMVLPDGLTIRLQTVKERYGMRARPKATKLTRNPLAALRRVWRERISSTPGVPEGEA